MTVKKKIADMSQRELFEDMAESLREISGAVQRADNREYETVQASSTQPWIVSYKNRKHVYMWLPANQTMSFEDFGSGTVQGQIWTNVGMPPGTRAFVTSSTTLVEILLCYTDEEQP